MLDDGARAPLATFEFEMSIYAPKCSSSVFEPKYHCKNRTQLDPLERYKQIINVVTGRFQKGETKVQKEV